MIRDVKLYYFQIHQFNLQCKIQFHFYFWIDQGIQIDLYAILPFRSPTYISTVLHLNPNPVMSSILAQAITLTSYGVWAHGENAYVIYSVYCNGSYVY